MLPTCHGLPSFDLGRLGEPSFTATTRGDVYSPRLGRSAKETDGEEGGEKRICIVPSSISRISLSYGTLNTSEHECIPYTGYEAPDTATHTDARRTLALRFVMAATGSGHVPRAG